MTMAYLEDILRLDMRWRRHDGRGPGASTSGWLSRERQGMRREMDQRDEAARREQDRPRDGDRMEFKEARLCERKKIPALG